MSENTTLPQRVSAAASIGVVNWKFGGKCVPPLFQNTQRSALLGSTPVQVCLPVLAWIGIWPRAGEPITLSIHCAKAAPFGLACSSIVSGGLLNVVLLSFQVAIVVHGPGRWAPPGWVA